MFVNDGSIDGTLELLSGLSTSSDKINLLKIPKNVDKAEAIRQGIQGLLAKNNFEYVGFWDADLSTPLDEIANILAILLEKEGLQIVLGSRIQRLGSENIRNSMRHYLSRVFATVASLMLNLTVYDTQCGAKIFKNNHLESVFSEMFISNWLFDIEILFRYKLIYYKKPFAHEYPLREWKDMTGSKIRFQDLISVPVQLVRIFFKYRNGH